jgi:hypothetical protein
MCVVVKVHGPNGRGHNCSLFGFVIKLDRSDVGFRCGRFLIGATTEARRNDEDDGQRNYQPEDHKQYESTRWEGKEVPHKSLTATFRASSSVRVWCNFVVLSLPQRFIATPLNEKPDPRKLHEREDTKRHQISFSQSEIRKFKGLAFDFLDQTERVITGDEWQVFVCRNIPKRKLLTIKARNAVDTHPTQ